MTFGICNLSIVPIRIEPSNSSEMISQLLFGEHFKIIDQRKYWVKIRHSFDNCEGWIERLQFNEISEELYQTITNNPIVLAGELIDVVSDEKHNLQTIPLGSSLPFYNNKKLQIADQNFIYEGTIYQETLPKENIISVAYKYLNSSYLWGGKSPFGIDSSGFTQMVYKMCGYKLVREAKNQATQGEPLSFIEESEPGDLAFFDDHEGTINHVGIIMNDNYIIHAFGSVRIDRIDHSGIFNVSLKSHTHKLRVIKKII